MRKPLLIVVSLVFAAICSYYLFSYILVRAAFSHDRIPNHLKFDKNVWQNGTPRQRGQMVDFLLDSIGLIGKTKVEIQAMTGPADYESDVADGEYCSRIYYQVDQGYTFPFDMVIFFDSTDHAGFILLDD